MPNPRLALTVALLALTGTAPAQTAPDHPPAADPARATPTKPAPRPPVPIDADPETKPSGPMPGELREEESRFFTYYYLRPDPDSFARMARARARADERLRGSASVSACFDAKVFARNPERIDGWLTELRDLPAAHRRVLWRAAALSETPQGTDALRAALQAAPTDAERTFIQRMLDTPAPDITRLALDSPDVLDMLWASFLAGGEDKYVMRIIEALPLQQEDKPSQIIIGSAAVWSLTSNAWQHSKVLAICQERVKNAPEEIAAPLRRIIAETEAKLKAEPCPEPNAQAESGSSR